MAAIAPQIKLAGWRRGLIRRGNAWDIPDDALTVATNVVVRNGKLEPLKGLGSAVYTAGSAPAWIWKLGANWLSSTSRRFAVPWEDDQLIYVTVGAAPPQRTNGTTTERLGIVAPATGPTAATGAAGAITGTNLSYVVTYLSALGQESAPSPASDLVSPSAERVNLSNIPTSGSLQRKLYRTNAAGVYCYVATLNAADTTYEDNTAVADLGDPILTEDYSEAPNLQGLALGKYRATLLGWIGSEVYQCEPGVPEDWNAGTSVGADVVAAVATPLGFLVLTAANPVLITGVDFESRTVTEYDNTYGCSAAFSVCVTDYGPVWWSPRGLILYTRGGSFVPLMVQHFDQDDIDGYSTAGMEAVYENGRVLLGHSGGTLICDLSEFESNGPVFTESTLTFGAAHRVDDGTAYVADGTAIKAWGAGSALTMTVRFKEFTAPSDRDRLHVHGAQIRHDGNATAQWYTGGSTHGASLALVPASGQSLCRIARDAWDRTALELTTSAEVHSVTLNPFSEAA